MKYSVIIATLTLSLFAMTAKGDYIVTIDNVTYDTFELIGTFNAAQTVLEGQPWWGNETLANDISLTLQNDYLVSIFDSNAAWGLDGGTVLLGQGTVPTDAVDGYVVGEVVSAVPEPSMLGLYGIGALGLGGYAWRKKKRTA